MTDQPPEVGAALAEIDRADGEHERPHVPRRRRARARGGVEDRARRKLGLPVLALGDEAIERIESSAADGRVLELLEGLPDAQRVAVRARVVDELGYDEIARELSCSPSVARKRVSRGLASLRSMWKEGQ